MRHMRGLSLSPDTLVVLACAATLAGVSACGDDLTSTDGLDEIGESEGGTETETDNPTPPPPELGGPAMGISITDVEINQGTAVLAARAGEWLGSDRNTYLVRNRDTVIRFQYVIDDPGAWIERDLTAFLHITPPGGGEALVRHVTRFVSEDSVPRVFTSSFYFSVLAEEAVPGTAMWIELRESDKSIDVSTLAPGLHSIPPEPEQIGFETTALEMKIMIVPVLYEHYDPPTLVEMDASDLTLFRDEMLQQNPVQTVQIEFRDEPLVRSQQLSSLGQLLGPTRELKIADGAADNVYYHALIDVRGSGVSDVAGIAWLTSASKSEGSSRVAATVFNRPVSAGDPDEGEEPEIFPPSQSARTWVHEVGHNQGFSHVACPGGGAAGPDPSYPYDDGKIGVFGFGIRNFHLYTPGAAHDYMSYCGNSWVSDWTWDKAYNRISTLTAWDSEGSTGGERITQPILVGLLLADGIEDWWIYDDVLPEGRSGAQSLEFWAQGEVQVSEYADVRTLSDGQGTVVTVPLPTALTGSMPALGGPGANHEVLEPGRLGAIDAVVRVTHDGIRYPVAVPSIHRTRTRASSVAR